MMWMKPCVLIAAPQDLNRRLSEALAPAFTVMACFERERAEVLVSVTCFQAIVVADGFGIVAPPAGGVPVIAVSASMESARVRDEVVAAVERRKATEHHDATELAALTALTALRYDEYIEMVRFRASRGYLLGLMQRHHGSVTDAARGAGMKRESLHRLLRRHDVDADRFRSDER